MTGAEDISNNLLLYGPPGTGKTYNVVNYAVAIIEDKPLDQVKEEGYDLALRKYDRYMKLGRVAFMTFHQSLSYDDFIEGIRPAVREDGSMVYVPSPGVFYKFCRDSENPEPVGAGIPQALRRVFPAASVWAVAPGGFGDSEERQSALEGGTLPLSCLPDGIIQGDIVISMYSKDDADAVGIVKDVEGGDAKVQWAIVRPPGPLCGIRVPFAPAHIFPKASDFLRLLEKEYPVFRDKGNCVFIIDEINRGNISRIFGELITLLESSRRKGMPECLEVYLPQMKVKFSVPQKVYVLGTMNTADRSLTALDTALRRRFQFVEMLPDPEVLKGRRVADVDLTRLLRTINKRVEALYDREHTLGHAYFIRVKTIDDLAEVFTNNVIPLLQEYFFDDYEKMSWVLGHGDDPRKCDFIKPRKRSNFQMLFNLPDVYDIVSDPRVYHDPHSYIAIYKGEAE
jgi:5-methylcytosine-specific restriction protein B